jgi:lipopolysaccharide transport system ATP-binding protein
MSDIAIHAEGLSKQYRIGLLKEKYPTLRERLSSAATGPVLAARRALRSRPGAVHEPPRRDAIWAIKDVSFQIKQGSVLGLIGANGAGKSTLLKVLSRITEPTEGLVDIYGRAASLLEVGTGFHPELTGRENIYLNSAILGMRRVEVKRKFDEIVSFAEVERFIDTPVKFFSTGMYMRLAFAVAAHLDPDILLVDEVLAVGDAAFQRKCLGKMSDVARSGRTVVFVSHNMGAIAKMCNEAMVLEHGSIRFMGGAQAGIHFYNEMVLARGGDGTERAPHVLYVDDPSVQPSRRDFRISRIEVLDADGQPKPVVGTWDPIIIRVTYQAQRRLERAAVALEISAADGPRMLVMSTQPDSNQELVFEPGEHSVDCIIDSLPLASGDYIIGAGLGIPNVEWLWYEPSLARLFVAERDVYGSGRAPVTSRALIAVPHAWRILS